MKTLIILHGWQSSKEKWQRVKEEIEKQACLELDEGEIEVIVPNLPGFKEGNELKRAWSLDDYVDWVREFILEKEKARFERSEGFFLLGHSFGGRIVIKFAVKYPEKLKGLILVSSAGIKPKKKICQFLIRLIVRISKQFSFLPGYEFLRKIFYKFVLRKTDYLKARGFLKETFKKVVSEDLTPLLSKVKVPTLIVWGEKDKIAPLSDAYLIKEKIKNSKLEILKNIDHIPHLKVPKKLAEVILIFLKHNL